MRFTPSDCRRARRDLLLRDDLDAVKRGVLDVHLRRCDDCRHIAETLTVIETGPGAIPEITEEQRQKIYRRLVPAVHEIAAGMEAKKSSPAPLWRSPVFAAGAGLAVIAALIAVVLVQPGPAGSPEIMARPNAVATVIEDTVDLTGFIDRRQGTVRIQGETAIQHSRFPLVTNTPIAMDKNAQLSFCIGDLAQVALQGETDWRLSKSTEKQLSLELQRGRLAIDFDSRSGRALLITTPNAEVRVTGTRFTVEVLSDGETTVGVVEGTVEVTPLGNTTEPIRVAAGNSVTVPNPGVLQQLTPDQRYLAGLIGPPDANTAPIADSSRPEKIRSTPRKTASRRPATAQSRGPARKKPRVAETPAKLQPPLTRARAAVTGGDLTGAIALLEQASEAAEGKELVTGLALLAECYKTMGRYAKAADTFEKIVAETPESRAAHNAQYEIGNLAMDQLGDFGKARAAFIAYVASHWDSGLKEDAYYSLCELDGRQGEHHHALHCFNRFLKSFPRSRHEPLVRLWRGALYQDLERRWTDAEKDLLFFISKRPGHPRADEARYRLALGRYQVGDKRGAMRAINDYLRQHPKGKYRLRVKRLKQTIIDPNPVWDPEK
jgi:TolA-binding protein